MDINKEINHKHGFTKIYDCMFLSQEDMICNNCKSLNIDATFNGDKVIIKCRDCGYEKNNRTIG